MKLTSAEIAKIKQDEKFKSRLWVYGYEAQKHQDDPEYKNYIWEKFDERQIEDYLWG